MVRAAGMASKTEQRTLPSLKKHMQAPGHPPHAKTAQPVAQPAQPAQLQHACFLWHSWQAHMSDSTASKPPGACCSQNSGPSSRASACKGDGVMSWQQACQHRRAAASRRSTLRAMQTQLSKLTCTIVTRSSQNLSGRLVSCRSTPITRPPFFGGPSDSHATCRGGIAPQLSHRSAAGEHKPAHTASNTSMSKCYTPRHLATKIPGQGQRLPAARLPGGSQGPAPASNEGDHQQPLAHGAPRRVAVAVQLAGLAPAWSCTACRAVHNVSVAGKQQPGGIEPAEPAATAAPGRQAG